MRRENAEGKNGTFAISALPMSPTGTAHTRGYRTTTRTPWYQKATSQKRTWAGKQEKKQNATRGRVKKRTRVRINRTDNRSVLPSKSMWTPTVSLQYTLSLRFAPFFPPAPWQKLNVIQQWSSVREVRDDGREKYTLDSRP